MKGQTSLELLIVLSAAVILTLIVGAIMLMSQGESTESAFCGSSQFYSFYPLDQYDININYPTACQTIVVPYGGGASASPSGGPSDSIPNVRIFLGPNNATQNAIVSYKLTVIDRSGSVPVCSYSGSSVIPANRRTPTLISGITIIGCAFPIKGRYDINALSWNNLNTDRGTWFEGGAIKVK